MYLKHFIFNMFGSILTPIKPDLIKREKQEELNIT